MCEFLLILSNIPLVNLDHEKNLPIPQVLNVTKQICSNSNCEFQTVNNSLKVVYLMCRLCVSVCLSLCLSICAVTFDWFDICRSFISAIVVHKLTNSRSYFTTKVIRSSQIIRRRNWFFYYLDLISLVLTFTCQ